MNITNLKSDINFLCGSTSGTYPDADKIRNLNIAYQNVATEIWRSADGWQYSNGKVTKTLTNNTQDYDIPTTAQKVYRVEVKDKSGTWTKLKPIDSMDIKVAISEFQDSPGLPTYYDLAGTSISLYPYPNSAYCTLSSGMQFFVDQDVTEFPVTASTATPAFATAFHRILSYAVAIDFVQDQNEKNKLIGLKAQLENNMRNLYSRRNVERPSRIKPRGSGRGSSQYI